MSLTRISPGAARRAGTTSLNGFGLLVALVTLFPILAGPGAMAPLCSVRHRVHATTAGYLMHRLIRTFP
jgi:hypothetical protein